MSTPDTDGAVNPGIDPTTLFEWLLVAISFVIVVAVFFIGPATNTEFHPFADYIGYLALAMLFGPIVFELMRARNSETDGPEADR